LKLKLLKNDSVWNRIMSHPNAEVNLTLESAEIAVRKARDNDYPIAQCVTYSTLSDKNQREVVRILTERGHTIVSPESVSDEELRQAKNPFVKSGLFIRLAPSGVQPSVPPSIATLLDRMATEFEHSEGHTPDKFFMLYRMNTKLSEVGMSLSGGQIRQLQAVFTQDQINKMTALVDEKVAWF